MKKIQEDVGEEGLENKQFAEKLGFCFAHRSRMIKRTVALYTPECSKRPSSKAAASEGARRMLRYVGPLSDATCLREAAPAKAGNAAG